MVLCQFKIIYYGTVTSSLQQDSCRGDSKNMLISYYKVMWVQRGCRPHGDQLGTDLQSNGDRLAIGWQLFLRLYDYARGKVYDCMDTTPQPIGDQSSTKTCAWNVCNHCDLSETGVTKQSPTSPWHSDHQNPPSNRCARRQVSLTASKSSLRPNRPCDICNLSATIQRPPYDLCSLPATAQCNSRKEAADRLEAMCDLGFIDNLDHEDVADNFHNQCRHCRGSVASISDCCWTEGLCYLEWMLNSETQLKLRTHAHMLCWNDVTMRLRLF